MSEGVRAPARNQARSAPGKRLPAPAGWRFGCRIHTDHVKDDLATIKRIGIGRNRHPTGRRLPGLAP